MWLVINCLIMLVVCVKIVSNLHNTEESLIAGGI
jgi:hypothetical protein